MSKVSTKEKLFRASRLDTNYQISFFKETGCSTPSRKAAQAIRDLHSARYKSFLRAKFGSKWVNHI